MEWQPLKLNGAAPGGKDGAAVTGRDVRTLVHSPRLSTHTLS